MHGTQEQERGKPSACQTGDAAHPQRLTDVNGFKSLLSPSERCSTSVTGPGSRSRRSCSGTLTWQYLQCKAGSDRGLLVNVRTRAASRCVSRAAKRRGADPPLLPPNKDGLSAPMLLHPPSFPHRYLALLRDSAGLRGNPPRLETHLAHNQRQTAALPPQRRSAAAPSDGNAAHFIVPVTAPRARPREAGSRPLLHGAARSPVRS